MKKQILFTLGVLCALAACRSQSPPPHALTIGDKVPDIALEHILNYKDTKAKLSEFKGKLVILDFWNTWCGACIKAFPKMDSLQKKFNKDIRIILVNTGDPKYDSKERVIKTLAKLKERTGFYPDLPVSILDTSLNRYFPHKTVPHEVWISKEGKVMAITDATEVSGKNIASLLAGKDPGMEVKNVLAFNGDEPVWSQGDGMEPDSFVYRSVFTPYIRNLGTQGGRRYNSDHKIIGAYNTNEPVIAYIRSAYYKELDACSHRVVWEVKDKSKYEYGNKANYYCYDLRIAPVSGDHFRFTDYLKADLERAFHITAKIETRTMKCYVLTGTNDRIKSAYTKYDRRDGDIRPPTIKKYLHHWPVSGLATLFSARLDIPLINETGLDNTFLDVTFPDHFSWTAGPEKIVQLIRNLGFRVTAGERKLKVLVITDRAG